MPDGSLLLTVREAAAQLGVGRDLTYQLIHAGRLRHVSLGRRILVPRDELAAFCEREANEPEVRP